MDYWCSDRFHMERFLPHNTISHLVMLPAEYLPTSSAVSGYHDKSLSSIFRFSPGKSKALFCFWIEPGWYDMWRCHCARYRILLWVLSYCGGGRLSSNLVNIITKWKSWMHHLQCKCHDGEDEDEESDGGQIWHCYHSQSNTDHPATTFYPPLPL